MSSFVILDGKILINAVDLSDHLTHVSVKPTADVKENTAMGAAGQSKTKLIGLKDWSVDAEFNQDFAAASVDATLWAIYAGAVPVAIEVRPLSTARATTNPAWTGNVLLPNYTPFDGAVGDLSVTKLTLEGTGAIARQTS